MEKWLSERAEGNDGLAEFTRLDAISLQVLTRGTAPETQREVLVLEARCLAQHEWQEW